MKKSTLLKLGFLVGMFAGSAAQSQVFNMHNIRHGYAFYGGYNIMYYGNGAYSDPGNNVWNGFGNGGSPGSTDSYGAGHLNDGLQPNNPGNPYAWSRNGFFANGANLFAPTSYGAAGAGNATSAGLHTPITVPTVVRRTETGGVIGGSEATVRQMPAFIFSAASLVNAGGAGVGTAGNPLGLMVLSNVPSGKYNLFLYGENGFNNDRGAFFYASNSLGLVGAPLNGITGCTNDHIGSPSASFVFGKNFVVITNVTPDVNGEIDIYWGAVSNYVANGNPPYTNTAEGDFCGLQLATNVPVFYAQQPNAIVANQGDNVSMNVVAGGSPLTYQWYVGNPPGTALTGQTGTTLPFNNVQTSAASNYFSVVTSGGTSVTSSVVSVTVYSKPQISSQYSTNGFNLFTGHNQLSLSVTAAGTLPVYFFWQTNGVTAGITTNTAGPGAGVFNTTTFNETNTAVPSSTYSCIVSNQFGTTNTQSVLVTASVPPTAYNSAVLSNTPVAYWTLSETSGQLAYDGVGGNNGSYQGGVAASQPGPPYAGFGAGNLAYLFDGTSAYLDVPVGKLNITGPMTLMLWELCVPPANFTTVVGHSDASYRIDVDTGGFPHFNIAGVGEPVGPRSVADLTWHQVVGVFDGTNNFLYVDGVLAAKTSNLTGATPFAGSQLDVWIGGDPQYGTGRLFPGTIDEVAIFSHALTAAQIQSIYVTTVPPPIILNSPLDTLPNALTNANEGLTVTMSVTAITPPLHYQWYEFGTGDPTTDTQWPFGATNAVLVLTNITAGEFNSFNGLFYCVVTNSVGSAISSAAQVIIQSGKPTIFSIDDLPPVTPVYLGRTAAMGPKNIYGTLPFSFQWTVGGSNVVNNAKYSGVTNQVLQVANAQASDTTTYQVSVTNIDSLGTPTLSATTTLYIETKPSFNTNGSGWSINGFANYNGAYGGTNVLTLTQQPSSSPSSSWYNYPMYIDAFIATFTYQNYSGTNVPFAGQADGAAFVLQNSSAGTAALGGGGGELGYGSGAPPAVQTVSPSAAILFNLYTGHALGVQYATNGGNISDGTADDYCSTVPVQLTNGHPVDVTVYYDGSTVHLTLQDELVGTNTYKTNMNVGSLKTVLGADTAYVGFTGAFGGVQSSQIVKNFSFTPLPTLTTQLSGNNVIITWPTSIAGYTLQQSSSLTGTFTDIAGPYPIVGGNYQVTVPALTGDNFYRLQYEATQ